VVFAAFGLTKGSAENLTPPFSHYGPVSVLLVLQIAPYFMVGFESMAKCSEEARPDFPQRSFFKAMVAAVVVGIVFYTSIIAVVAYLHPWPLLLGHSFATAYAFETAFGQRWIVQIIFLAALLSLLKVFNGNFLASSRMLFALGRREFIPPRFGHVHKVNQTPAPAVLAIGMATGAAAFFGEALLIPITEVGAMASACGWFAACMAFVYMKPLLWQRGIALCGAIVAALLVTMKLAPGIPGHFTPHEWGALGGWCVLGLVLRLAARRQSPALDSSG